MATTSEKLQANRVKLREWFLENDRANIHTALNVALRENRGAGLTKDLASALRQEALNELAVRAEAKRRKDAEEAAKLASVQCSRCQQFGHYASTCTVELKVELPPPPVKADPVPFQPSPEDHPDAPETQLRALQYVLGLMADGEILTMTNAQWLGAKVGTDKSWRKAFDTLRDAALLERAAGSPGMPHLWAAHAGKETNLRALAENDLKLAGLLWQGAESRDEANEAVLDEVRLTDKMLAEERVNVPVTDLSTGQPIPTPPPPPEPSQVTLTELRDQLTALFNLMEANLQVSQGLFNLMMAKGGKP